MTETCLRYADLTIITTDNPRDELPENIIRDMTENFLNNSKLIIIKDRAQAIKQTISMMNSNDILVIAGKGHEDYQEISGKKIHFSDKEEVQKYFTSPEICSEEDNSFTIRLSFPLDILQILKILNKEFTSANSLFEYISTDSRTIEENSLFFALSGEKFDGHKFVEKVLEDKTCYAVVKNSFNLNSDRLIKVEDVNKAYTQLAAFYKSIFSARTFAITGSTGKTTTKEYLYNILSEKGKTLKSLQNENNIFGLCKTIFRLSREHDFAIYELGSNHFGEISAMADICKPEIGIVTSIGNCHLEFLNDLDGVFKEKSALLEKTSYLKIFPFEEHRFYDAGIVGKSFGYSAEADFHIEILSRNDEGFLFNVNDCSFSLPSRVDHNVTNAAIAIAAAWSIIPNKEIIQVGLNKKIDTELRMQIIQMDKKNWIFDCYNANPESMKSALLFWRNYKPELIHYAILGDMLELGAKSQKLHQDVKKILADIPYEKVFTIGSESILYHGDIHFVNVDEFINSNVFRNMKSESVILVKGSHGIHLEKILEILMNNK